jgi:3-methyladenine DNA glycosylase AlkD
MLKEIEQILKKEAEPERAKILQRFFKTGKGEYGEGDIFLGIVVPKLREISKQFKELKVEHIKKLINSEIHEKRLLGLFILRNF